MMEPGARVTNGGDVIATLKNVTGFTDFSSVPGEQSGHYFPFTLNTTGSTMTIKKNGVAAEDKTNIKFDPSLLLRVESTSDTFEVEVDGESFITLKFTKAVLKE